MKFDVVVATIARGSLSGTLFGLASGDGPLPERVIVVDDRHALEPALVITSPAPLRDRLMVVCSGGRGPATARNLGAMHGGAEWIVFLDDDVLPPAGWRYALEQDLIDADEAAGSQGRVRVPLALDRNPNDWERSVKGLEIAAWTTADMAYRRDAFAAAGGFDERFPRAYREDADLGLRLTMAGGHIVRGRRFVEHPVRPARWWTSISRQRGNSDDALMLFLHGPGWQDRAGAARGTRSRHLIATALLAAGAGARLAGHRQVSNSALAGWLGLTLAFAHNRIAPGPPTPREVTTTALTSAAIPVAASYWWLFGMVRAWRLTRRPAAVLVDRDGTLVQDVPYNGDPALVRPLPGARAALDRLRQAGIRVAMVTNQSGVARGVLTEEQVRAVNAKVEEMLGPMDATLVCFHGPDDRCSCRKPRPGLVLAAARRLGVQPARCAVIGDVEADVVAARRAGARGLMVPTPQTKKDEVARAREVSFSLEHAVARLLGPAS
jgi:histidinol-phosphate phosphatase family protein